MATSIKRLLVGNPLRSEQAAHERLAKKTALAVYSSDALSSVAYSTEAILLVLLAAGTAAIGYLVPIVIGITALLGILALSYRQTIHAYPNGGGAYIVAKDNLGTTPGLVAGASLLVDYILTVAVSVSAGVAAITSAAQGTRFEFLEQHRVAICIGLVAFIAVINLRGVKESGAIFAGPTYLFILSMFALIVVGFAHYYSTGEVMPTPPAEQINVDSSVGATPHNLLTGGAVIWLVLRAFASGCTALTGVEAISNGIPSFQAYARSASCNARGTDTASSRPPFLDMHAICCSPRATSSSSPSAMRQYSKDMVTRFCASEPRRIRIKTSSNAFSSAKYSQEQRVVIRQRPSPNCLRSSGVWSRRNISRQRPCQRTWLA